MYNVNNRLLCCQVKNSHSLYFPSVDKGNRLYPSIDFQILNFTRPEGGIRVSRTL